MYEIPSSWKNEDYEADVEAHVAYLEMVANAAKQITPYADLFSVQNVLNAQSRLPESAYGIISNEMVADPMWIPGHTVKDKVLALSPTGIHPSFSLQSEMQLGPSVLNEQILNSIARIKKAYVNPEAIQGGLNWLSEAMNNDPLEYFTEMDDWTLSGATPIPALAEKIIKEGAAAQKPLANRSLSFIAVNFERGKDRKMLLVPIKFQQKKPTNDLFLQGRFNASTASIADRALAAAAARSEIALSAASFSDFGLAVNVAPNVALKAVKVDLNLTRGAHLLNVGADLEAAAGNSLFTAMHITQDGEVRSGFNPAFGAELSKDTVSVALTDLPQSVQLAQKAFYHHQAIQLINKTLATDAAGVIKDYFQKLMDSDPSIKKAELGGVGLTRVTGANSLDKNKLIDYLKTNGMKLDDFMETGAPSIRAALDKKNIGYQKALVSERARLDL